LWGPVVGTVVLEPTSALAQSWLGGGRHPGVQLTLYAVILIAVILWQPTGLLGALTGAYRRLVRASPGGLPGTAAAARNAPSADE